MRDYTQTMDILATTLHIPSIFTTTTPPTPLNTPVNRSKTWSHLPDMSSPISTFTSNLPPINNQNICLPLKYQSQFCYYTDGSFIPPKALTQEQWIREKTGYGIYNPLKKLKIA